MLAVQCKEIEKGRRFEVMIIFRVVKCGYTVFCFEFIHGLAPGLELV